MVRAISANGYAEWVQGFAKSVQATGPTRFLVYFVPGSYVIGLNDASSGHLICVWKEYLPMDTAGLRKEVFNNDLQSDFR